MKYFWYQPTGGSEAWQHALSEHREKILADIRPAFTTVLDASAIPEKGMAKEELDEIKYSGPFYLDWDAESIEEAIEGFHAFLKKMTDGGVNLHSLRLYATGGRGFHVEVPAELFMPKVPKGGTSFLPGIYREMAMEYMTPCLDMRIYTAKRGRMWRTPNVLRSNGMYKVPLSVDQALRMTAEDYELVCAKPAGSPPIHPPELNIDLSTVYSKCHDKITKAVKNRSKTNKDRELLAKFKGEWPKSIKRIMNCEGIIPGTGFNRIAMQLAITANALGKSAEDLIEQCEGLIANHDSDGRYNSPRKRKQALREMWHYTNESDAYSYSRGGIRSLLEPDVDTSDLDGAEAYKHADYVPTSLNEEDEPEEFKAAAEGNDSLYQGIRMSTSGVWKRGETGFTQLSNLAFADPAILVDSESGVTLGIEADIKADKKFYGRHVISAKAFQSRANLSAFCQARNGIFNGTDIQAGIVGLKLQKAATEVEKVIYVVRREGLDLIQNPENREVRDLHPAWISADGVLTYATDVKYRYQSLMASKEAYNCDLHTAKPLRDTPDTRAWLKNLLNMNSPTVVAQMMGWFVSCFHKQHYQRLFKQFPLLHPNGPAGSGKTMTASLMARLFYNVNSVKTMSAGDATVYTLKNLWASSASIPLLIDEYKPAELRADKLDFLLRTFKIAYNQGYAAMGGISNGSAESSFRDITEYAFSAPTVYMGESQEMQTAILQRSIPLNFNPDDSKAHTPSFDLAVAGADFLPQLGRILLGLTIGWKKDNEWIIQPESLESRAEALRPIVAELRASFDRSVHDRQVYNLAVVLEGLNFLDRALQSVYGTDFCDDVNRLRQAVYDHKSDIQVAVMSEPAKVLNDMALISRTEPSDSEYALREGYEYVITEDHIEILMHEAFVKYFSWSKRKGFQPLFQNNAAFTRAMEKFPAMVDALCFSSVLRTSGTNAKVFRFDLAKMSSEGIEGFKSKLTG
jgi:hypothetical protein